MPDISIKQGEAKTVTFAITDAAGDAVDVSSATLALKVRPPGDDTDVISKADGDFNKDEGASGIVSVVLTATDSNQTPAPNYNAQLKIVFSATNIDISKDITVAISSSFFA